MTLTTFNPAKQCIAERSIRRRVPTFTVLSFTCKTGLRIHVLLPPQQQKSVTQWQSRGMSPLIDELMFKQSKMLFIFQMLITNSGSLLGMVVVIVMLHINDVSPITEQKLFLTQCFSVSDSACLFNDFKIIGRIQVEKIVLFMYASKVSTRVSLKNAVRYSPCLI